MVFDLSGSQTARHHPQIDGLRVFAMLGVFYVHYWNHAPATEHARVSLFFVVSGFLITNMLLRARESHANLRVARNFYIRRALRLLPPLLLALVVMAAFDMDGVRSSLPWHLLQLTNLRTFLYETWTPWVTAHLWSLNTLEQFYIFAPLVVLFVPIRRIFLVALAVLAGSILVRVNAQALGIEGWIGIFAAYDPIAGGALLALLLPVEPLQAMLRSRAAIAAALAFIFLPIWFGAGFGNSESYRVGLIPALIVLVSAAWHGMGGPLGAVLGNGAVKWLSQISYGAYVYHFPLWWLVAEHYPSLYQKGPRTLVIMGALSLLAATLSWYGMERPLARLKRHFPTRLPPDTAPAAVPAKG